MARAKILRRVDRFLRRQDTWLASVLAGLSPRAGAAYSASSAKRTLDLLISIPAAVFVIPLILVLMLGNPGPSP